MRLHRLPLAASLCSLLFATLAAGPVGAEDAPLPSDPAAELARADKLKREAASLRGMAEERFRDEEIACYQRFLVNRCIEQARARDYFCFPGSFTDFWTSNSMFQSWPSFFSTLRV